MKIINHWDTDKGICIIEKKDGLRQPTFIDRVDWYFYMLTDDTLKWATILKEFHEKGFLLKKENFGQYTKIYAVKNKLDPSNIALNKDFREFCYSNNIPVFEYDLTKSKRYVIDNNLEIETDLKVLYFDIETDDSKGGIEIGRDRIISIAATDENGKQHFKMGDEEKILKWFITLIKKFDIITGWNSEGFDLPYIQQRCERYNIRYNWNSIIHVDMMQRCFKVYAYQATILGIKNFKLNEISRIFLKEEKTELQGLKIHVLEKENPDLLKEYNLKDVELLLKLDKKLNIIPLMITEGKMTGSTLNKFYIGELLDNYILRNAKSKDIILTSKPADSQYLSLQDVQVTGGYVAEPKTGLYNYVHICDFKSLYPSIIIGYNIGLDVLNEDLSEKGIQALTEFLHGRKIEVVDYLEWQQFLTQQKKLLDPDDKYIQTANNCFYSRETRSFIGGILQDLLDLRKEYKKKLKGLEVNTPEYVSNLSVEHVIKEMANSMFGITCDKRGRYFNKKVAESITYTGQFMNKLSSYIATQDGLNVIYGDTDSIFVTGVEDFDDKIIMINEKLSAYLTNVVKVYTNIVQLEYEKKYRRLLMLEKKRYTGLLCMKDGKEVNIIFSRGTEDVKKSNALIGRKKFTEFTKLVLTSDVTEDMAIEYVKKLKDWVYNGDLNPLDLVLINKVSRSIDHYKSLSIHTRLAKRLIDSGKLLPIVENRKGYGTRLEYIIVDQGGKREGVLEEEFDGTCDREYYWSVQVYAPILRVLECIWPDTDWKQYLGLISKQNSLF